MGNLCFQATVGAYIALGGLSVGFGTVVGMVLCVEVKELFLRRRKSIGARENCK